MLKNDRNNNNNADDDFNNGNFGAKGSKVANTQGGTPAKEILSHMVKFNAAEEALQRLADITQAAQKSKSVSNAAKNISLMDSKRYYASIDEATAEAKNHITPGAKLEAMSLLLQKQDQGTHTILKEKLGETDYTQLMKSVMDLKHSRDNSITADGKDRRSRTAKENDERRDYENVLGKYADVHGGVRSFTNDVYDMRSARLKSNYEAKFIDAENAISNTTKLNSYGDKLATAHNEYALNSIDNDVVSNYSKAQSWRVSQMSYSDRADLKADLVTKHTGEFADISATRAQAQSDLSRATDKDVIADKQASLSQLDEYERLQNSNYDAKMNQIKRGEKSANLQLAGKLAGQFGVNLQQGANKLEGRNWRSK